MSGWLPGPRGFAGAPAARWLLLASVGVLIASLCAVTMESARAQGPDVGTEAQRESGRQLYVQYCSQCHGDKGDGEGVAAPFLSPKPRDFTTGKYKVRTTPSGALPSHQDLVNIIRRGMPYTSMPGWPTLTNQEVRDLAYFLTTFSAEFSNGENAPEPVPLESAPRATEESIELGKKLYHESGCVQCHGTLGRGDGPTAPTLRDDWGQPVRAADLAQSWTFRGGSSREDIFRTMSTGFNGTPMPSFLEALTPEQRWAITDYIVSLSGDEGPRYTNLVRARRVQEAIDLANGAATFESAPVARFPIVGQIMESGRSFHPLVTSVTVQAVYDVESIAVLVRWHDMSAEKTGKNGPSLPVPPEEEGQGTVPAPAGGESPEGSVWGDEDAAPAPPQAQQPDASVWGEAEVAPTPGTAQQPDEDIWGEQEGAAAPSVAPSEFSDAVAIQIPSQAPVGARKPYFIFGDGQNPVDLWFFDLADSEPLQFTGRGSADIAPNDTGDITGVASYDQGEWSVIFKRPLRASSGVALAPGQFVPMAFSVWDGFSRERGNKRGLTAWYSLYVEPEEVASAVGPMIRTAFFILVIELILIGWVRRRYGSGAGEAVGDEGRRQEPAPSV